MRRIAITVALAAMLTLPAAAQTALDAYSLSTPDMRGTARFMGMAGAFTALGGDLSTLNQNPGGIGVYRTSEIGVTLDIDVQSLSSLTQGFKMGRDQTKVACNNFGYIGAVYTGSEVMPYFNWGASYSRVNSFNRAYRGRIGQLNGSLSNYIAGYTSAEGWTQSDLTGAGSNGTYNPYIDSQAPWMSILAYNSFMINPTGNSTQYSGLWQQGASGTGGFDVVEKGYVDEYSINFGGNVLNTLFWGVGFGITDLDYTSSVYYEEDFSGGARIPAPDNQTGTVTGAGGFGLDSWKHINGTGFNFKVGAILKPINELRFGVAVHTPTYYNLKQEGFASVDYGYGSGYSGVVDVNEGYTDYFEWKLRTPWRLMAGVAGVIGGRGIVSMDYEYRPMQSINVRDQYSNEWTDVNSDVKQYYKATSILRIGAEYRLDRHFSLRAGYAIQTQPSTTEARDNRLAVYTSGPDDTETTPSYTFDGSTQYVSCGVGYRYKGFYVDATYLHKHRKSTFSPYTPNDYTAAPVTSELTANNSQIIISAGFKF